MEIDEKARRIAMDVGRASFEALQYAKGLVKPGASLLDVSERIESYLREKGMGSAFPVNISANERAAHYTPSAGDTSTFADGDLVKVDLGARSGDTIGDCALTVDLSGRNANLVQTTAEALEAAVGMVRAGRQVREMGKEVERISKSKGFNPITNLGGHAIESGELHAGLFIPNFDNGDATELEEGQTIAVEVFLTNGAGYVVDSDYVQIFRKLGEAAVRSEDARRVAAFIDKTYGTYPFALRWLVREFGSEFKVRKALNEFASLGVLESFPALVEKTNGLVAQAEKEMIVEKDSCTVLTA